MNKECPHCHEKSFGWRDLLVLDCFALVQCRECHQWALASGWRQLVGVLTFIGIFVAAMPLMQFVPGESSALLIPVAFIVFGMSMVLTTKPIKADSREVDKPAFTPDPNNDKTILVQGWSETELRRILADFVEEDLTMFSSFGFEIEMRLENSFVLTFPEDIHPNEFGSLVLYLASPIGFDLQARTVVVAGKATLNSDFDGLPQSLEGEKAIFYLPEQDKDYDLVYLQTESGLTMAKSVNQGVWRKVKESRLPDTVTTIAW